MKVLGIDFDARKALFVLVTMEDDQPVVVDRATLTLGETRVAPDLKKFQSEMLDVLRHLAADRIAIKGKPENGQMRAGAAALKMEGLIMAAADVPVEFVSGVAADKVEKIDGIFAYQQSAYRAAVVGFKDKAAPKAKARTKPKKK